MIKVKWDGPAHPEFHDLIVEEVDWLLENGLPEVADLIFHSIWLDNGDPHGRTIMLFGADGDEAVHAEYIEKPTLVDATGNVINPKSTHQ